MNVQSKQDFVIMLHMENITKTFAGKRLFSSYSLKLRHGEKVLLQGASGCGKSTLLKMILGFEVPDTGEIFIDGDLLTGQSVWELRRKMSYVPQEPELEPGTCFDFLQSCLRFSANAGVQGGISRVPDLLKAFGLADDLLTQRTEKLSGGEKQRLTMIAAVMLERPLILMDEPSSALDPDSRRRAIDFFVSHKSMTILAVSHDHDWEGMSDRVEIIGDGG